MVWDTGTGKPAFNGQDAAPPLRVAATVSVAAPSYLTPRFLTDVIHAVPCMTIKNLAHAASLRRAGKDTEAESISSLGRSQSSKIGGMTRLRRWVAEGI